MESGHTSTEGVEQRLIDDGRVAVLTINRPAARNALSSGVIREPRRGAAEAGRRRDGRAVVLTGAAPGFCAGSDLKELGGMSVAEMASHEADTGRFVRSLQRLDIPVVAAVEGFALGGGFLLATGCDLVVTAGRRPLAPARGRPRLGAAVGPADAGVPGGADDRPTARLGGSAAHRCRAAPPRRGGRGHRERGRTRAGLRARGPAGRRCRRTRWPRPSRRSPTPSSGRRSRSMPVPPNSSPRTARPTPRAPASTGSPARPLREHACPRSATPPQQPP